MADTGDIRKGLCIDYNHDIFVITDFQHVKPARGAAFVRTSMKSMTNGKTLENTWSSGHKIDIVRVERRKFQFLYKDESGLNLMDNESFEQLAIPEDMVDSPQFLKEGMEVDILYHAEKTSRSESNSRNISMCSSHILSQVLKAILLLT